MGIIEGCIEGWWENMAVLWLGNSSSVYLLLVAASVGSSARMPEAHPTMYFHNLPFIAQCCLTIT